MPMPSPTRRTVLAEALILTARGARAAAPLRVVASSVPHSEILEFVTRTLAPGFPLKLIETSGDIRPNALLRDGDADANFFQHAPFLHAEEALLGVAGWRRHGRQNTRSRLTMTEIAVPWSI